VASDPDVARVGPRLGDVGDWAIGGLGDWAVAQLGDWPIRRLDDQGDQGLTDQGLADWLIRDCPIRDKGLIPCRNSASGIGRISRRRRKTGGANVVRISKRLKPNNLQRGTSFAEVRRDSNGLIT
jgi:hypothetical protein